ncbi:hypothetical protein [Hymenobacter metallicola]|uniref:Uncharacterized protein n=1 Tax=Hymenobacter metallicola TaxID=2563114 RepID=A0A4Z0QFM2_9BACT|nr:hypothetical protein [Hymenobacter metallicola]TGE28266.1 hypothetical protein E5K02_02025 [Hymenobacter metallicola]
MRNIPWHSGFSVTAGARIKPLPGHRNVQVVFELTPYANRFLNGRCLRTTLALAYNFRRPK